MERNVFIHYNVRLQLRNMKRARNWSEQEQYCPINLDYIFAENDSLLPWLEQREKEKDIANSEKENYSDLVQITAQATQEEVIAVEEDSNATQFDSSNDDDDGGGCCGGDGGSCGGTSETFVPSTFSYPHSSSSQAQYTSGDHGMSPTIEEEEEDEEDEEDEKEEDKDV